MKAWLILFAAVPALAEITDNTTVKVDSRTGVSVQGQASFSFSLSGTDNRAAQQNSPYLLVPNPNFRPVGPGSTSSSLTDSKTFFDSIGKDSAPKPERRRRRSPQTAAPEAPESAQAPAEPTSLDE